MAYRWDEAKRAANLAKHGVDFTEAEGFDWSAALVRADLRADYGEVRLVGMAPIGDRLHVLVFTIRRRGLRVISLRRASAKELKRYEAEA
ncbi:BrnT family toxin [Craurococcus roseus]|uniref:BrnT family toxin n=1 Tax=Craurococcus roseus TaxID=77585 RepID=UPI0031D8B49C